MNSNSDNRRLAKNTLMLYVRTLFIMCIGLFTSRVILQSLGVDDYGIYNVVGGYVGMFSIITQSLVSTTQRYITVELGKGSTGNPKKMFGVVLYIHLGLAILMILIFESFGLYFLNHKLNIPQDRLFAANWVFQISVISSVLGLLSTPYMGVIVAHERMKAFAFIGLQDAILRLIICYALYVTNKDRLIVYALLLGFVSIWNQLLYMGYCRKHFAEVRTWVIKDRTIIKSVFGFTGMNFLGSFAHILSTEGVTIIVNLFFGVALNAARAIAIQVQNLVGRFTGDFMMALNPQITKEYSGGDKETSMTLCLRGAKFCYLIVLVLAIPISFRTPQLLTLWLGEYPSYTVEFVRLTLIVCMLGVISNPLITMNLAVGKIQSVSLWVGGTRLAVLPLLYMCFKLGGSPTFSYYVVIFMDVVLLFIRLKILDLKTGLTFTRCMCNRVLMPAAIVTLASVVILYFVNLLFPAHFIGLVVFSLFAILFSSIVSYFLALNNTERTYVKKMAQTVMTNCRNITLRKK